MKDSEATQSSSWGRGWSRICTGAFYTTLVSRLHAAEGQADYRVEVYQEDHDRIRVVTHTVHFKQSISPWLELKGSAVYDGISGATPTGAPPSQPGGPVPLATMDDIRLAGQMEASIRTGMHRWIPQFSYSEEDDYISRGLALNHQWELNQRNTTLILGGARNWDRVSGGSLRKRWEDKSTADLLFGVTQVIDPKTVLNVTATLGSAWGELSDPYKGFRFTDYPDPEALFADRRPGHRTKQILHTSLNHHVESMQASWEGAYRFYHDSMGIRGHTFSLEWFQDVGPKLTISPLIRYYRQQAASFYQLSFPSDPTDSGNPSFGSIPQFYSADYRLSHMETWTWGLGLTWKQNRWMQWDVAYHRYLMDGLDGLTPSEAYARAHIVTLGIRLRY